MDRVSAAGLYEGEWAAPECSRAAAFDLVAEGEGFEPSSGALRAAGQRATGVTLRIDESVIKAIRYRVDGWGVLGDNGGDGACSRAGPLTRSRIGSSTNV